MNFQFNFNPTRAGRAGGLAGKIFTTFFFLVFVGMGSLFLALIAKSAMKSVATYSWKATPCEILASKIAETRGNTPYKLSVKFRYHFVGHDYESTQQRLEGNQAFSDYEKAELLAQKYRANRQVTCYVNPTRPEQAILQRGSLMAIPFAIIPLIFICVGLGGIFFTWRSNDAKAILRRSKWSPQSGSKLVPSIAFAVFFLIGFAILYFAFLPALTKSLQSRNWPETPCTVISSHIRSYSGSKNGTTYSVDILYAYRVGGRDYRSNRSDFFNTSSSGYQGKAAIVRAHPPGSKMVCYVNPNDPSDAVLRRGLGWGMLFGLIPLVFMCIGGVGIWSTLRGQKQKTTAVANHDLSANREAGPLTLKPQWSPLAKFGVAILVALFWNGIVSVFVTEAAKSWLRGQPDIFLTVFMIPFVLIGLGAIGYVGYSVLALWNPRIRLTLTPGALTLGETAEVAWEIGGSVSRIEQLRIYIEGREEATYQNGKNTSTAKNIFANHEVAKIVTRPEMRAGSAHFTIPADTIHSFNARNNKIVWEICVCGEIPHWPDMKEDFPVTVQPLRKNA